MPVVSPVRMSVIAIARGWKPLALYHCVIRSSPADVYSFARFEIGDGLHRLLREHLQPAAVAPVHQHEALGFDPLLEQRRQLLDDGIELVVGLEEERDVEDVEGPVDARRGRRP